MDENTLTEIVNQAVGDFGSLLFNAGASVVRGLLNGIKSMAGAVTSDATLRPTRSDA